MINTNTGGRGRAAAAEETRSLQKVSWNRLNWAGIARKDDGDEMSGDWWGGEEEVDDETSSFSSSSATVRTENCQLNWWGATFCFRMRNLQGICRRPRWRIRAILSLSPLLVGYLLETVEAVGGTRRRKVQAEVVEICWLRRGDGRAGNEIFRKSTENKNKFLKPGLVAGAALLLVKWILWIYFTHSDAAAEADVEVVVVEETMKRDRFWGCVGCSAAVVPDSIRRQQQQLLEIGGNDDVCRRGSLCCRSFVGWMVGNQLLELYIL